jgi:AcrR family transcriptional regulator
MPRVSASEREATRLRLLDAGKQEFAERGLAGARFDEISIAAGHAKGTIYNYFESKEALFFTIVAEWCEQLIAAYVVPDDASARQRLLSLATIDVDIAREDPDLARVVVQQMPALAGTHRSDADAAVWTGLELLTTTFADGLASGELSSKLPPKTLARLFLTVLSSYESEALLPVPSLSLDDVVDLVDVTFLAGVSS